MAKLVEERHLTPTVAQETASHLVIGEIVADLPGYLASMPILIYRGIWVDDYALVGIPLLAWALWRGLKGRDWRSLGILSPGVWSIFVYPAISLNITRYQDTALPVIAIAVAMAVSHSVERKTVSSMP